MEARRKGKLGYFSWHEGKERRILILAVMLFVAVWGGISWFLARDFVGERSQRLIEREQEIATATAASIGTHIGLTLAQMRTVPQVLARQPEIEKPLARMGGRVAPARLPPAQLRAVLAQYPDVVFLARQLEALVTELNIDRVLVINAAGDCIASGGFAAETSPTGTNYADRLYFQMAKESGNGRQFAVGRTTDVPGIFYSSAVMRGGVFLGAVVIKIDLPHLFGRLADPNLFVTDELGVVVAAGDRAYYMHATPGAGVAGLSPDERESRYRRQEFPSLEITPFTFAGLSLTRLSGREAPMLGAVSGAQTDLLKVWVYRDLSELSPIGREGALVFVLLFLVGGFSWAAILAGWLHFRRDQAYRREITRINDELRRANEELQVQARFDALTGCCNRRYFWEELTLEMRRAKRFSLPLCLVVLDIDHFKQVNDVYGHACGDALLQSFVRVVQHTLRSSDLLGRIGGEEFAIMMPQTSLPGAVDVAERVRAAIADARAFCGENSVSMTVSCGVVQWRGEGESIEALIAHADEAMYVAKRGGRNRVCAESEDFSGAL